MNGSGKSTLIKVLSGYHAPDAGTIELSGPAAAGMEASSIAFVHQDLGLVSSMTVLENLTLGRRLATRFGRIDWRSEREPACKALAPFGLEHLVDSEVKEITRAEATIVALVRALEQCGDGCSLLVLDEPTSALPASETETLLSVMRDCASDGIGVLFVSHRLREVLSVSDEVTALRNGHVVWNGATTDATLESLVEAMTAGARIDDDQPRTRTAEAAESHVPDRGPRVLEARNLCGETLDHLDLELFEREILGVVGLLGSGLHELAALLAGRTRPSAGVVQLAGQPLAHAGRELVGLVPADRKQHGILSGLPAAENLLITHRRRHMAYGRIARRRETAEARQWLSDLMVDPPDPVAGIDTFSGGNQQKIILGRWLSVSPRVLIAEEPTQGVDVLAKAHILEEIRARAEAGLSVAILSGEPEEIVDVCHRVAVLRRGALVAEFRPPLELGQIVAALH
jgi:ribose transport system ATP-binding protein